MDGGQVRERGVRAEMGAAADGGAAAAADGGEAGRFLEVGRFLEAAADGGSLRRRRIGVRRRRMGCHFLAGQWVRPATEMEDGVRLQRGRRGADWGWVSLQPAAALGVWAWMTRREGGSDAVARGDAGL
jgi:hypothetical protein